VPVNQTLLQFDLDTQNVPVSRFALRGSLAFLAMSASLFAQGNATVRQVTLLPATRDVEIEIQSTHRVSPETQVVTGPDRLVIDFPGAVPSAQLRTLAVNRGGVKSVRSGLFRSNPPVTRVVLDLDGPLPYQVFPSGSSVIVKLGKGQGAANSMAAAVPAPQEPPPPPPPVIEVHLQNGLMSLTAERTNLAAVLAEIRKQTGADVSIPAGAEQEQVVAKLGPAPTRDVVAALLNGSRYNFVLVGSDNDSSLRRLILTPKGSGMVIPATPAAYTPPPGPPVRIAQPQPEPENDATQIEAKSRVAISRTRRPAARVLSRMGKPQSREHQSASDAWNMPPQ
jgi:hypothetical protein